MEERLNAILARIEHSNLPQEDKYKLYGIIAEGLKASIWPTLLSAMPQDKLSDFTKKTGKASVESYIALIEEATKDGNVVDEIDETMNKLLDEVDAALREEQI